MTKLPSANAQRQAARELISVHRHQAARVALIRADVAREMGYATAARSWRKIANVVAGELGCPAPPN